MSRIDSVIEHEFNKRHGVSSRAREIPAGWGLFPAAHQLVVAISADEGLFGRSGLTVAPPRYGMPHPPDTLAALVARIRSEFDEMPGLHLALGQATRLWHLDEARCRAVLEALVQTATCERPREARSCVIPGAGEARSMHAAPDQEGAASEVPRWSTGCAAGWSAVPRRGTGALTPFTREVTHGKEQHTTEGRGGCRSNAGRDTILSADRPGRDRPPRLRPVPRTRVRTRGSGGLVAGGTRPAPDAHLGDRLTGRPRPRHRLRRMRMGCGLRVTATGSCVHCTGSASWRARWCGLC